MSTSESNFVMGRWHNMTIRCHKCNRPVNKVYVVSDPPITGKFCGKNCYQLARDHYEQERTKD